MSEQNNVTLSATEDIIKEKLTSDTQKNALDFVAFMKANEMPPKLVAENCWTFAYSEEAIHACVLAIYPDESGIGWTIFDNPLTSQYDDFPANDKLKEFAWAHVNLCTSCGGSSGCGKQPGRCKTIFGKKYDNVCTSEVAFRNPDTETLKTIMQMIGIWKLHIDNDKQKGE